MNRRPIPALSDAQSADKVALLRRAADTLRAGGRPEQGDAVEELLCAAQTFTHELAEALAMAQGWKAQYEQAKGDAVGNAGLTETYSRMWGRQAVSSDVKRIALEGVLAADTLEAAQRIAKEALR